MRSRRRLIERSENDSLEMAYPTGLEKLELTAMQLYQVVYAVAFSLARNPWRSPYGSGFARKHLRYRT